MLLVVRIIYHLELPQNYDMNDFIIDPSVLFIGNKETVHIWLPIVFIYSMMFGMYLAKLCSRTHHTCTSEVRIPAYQVSPTLYGSRDRNRTN